MKDFDSPVLEALRAALFADGGGSMRNLVLAVSGGEDSTVLLHAVNSLREELRLRLVVAHFNHRLRAQSDEEERFVVDTARRLGLVCCSAKAENSRPQANVEAWAREARYEFLESVRLQEQCGAILTAHHQRDQAETLLFRLLSGRLPGRSIVARDGGRKIVRPFLSLGKEVLRGYALNHALVSMHDASNDDTTRTRNRIRHRLLPLLEKDYNPRVVQALAAEAGRLAEDDEYLSRLAQDMFEAAKTRGVKEALSGLPRALAWRALRSEAIKQLGQEAGKIPYSAFCFLGGVIARGRSGFHPLHGTIQAELSQGKILFSRPACTQVAEEVVLNIPGEAVLPGSSRCLAARILGQTPVGGLIKEANREQKAYFDRDLLGIDRLIVRPRLPGDRMNVWRRGTRKVKKLLQERHLTLTERSWVPIVLCKEEIIWIPGVARSGAAPVSEDTRSIVELTFTPGITGK